VIFDSELSAPMIELLASQNDEIAKYKWFESQRLGRDIGWRTASDEWFEKLRKARFTRQQWSRR
jgi:hypothetical protein